MEIESALVAHPRVAEAAVVGKPHDIKGESVFAFVVLQGSSGPTGDTDRGVSCKSCATGSASNWAPSPSPTTSASADNLPKTRSGKIMRRLLRAIARGEEITQDISTLENPAIVDQLRGDEAMKAAPKTPAKRKPVPKKKTAPKKKPAPRKKAVSTVKRAPVKKSARKKVAVKKPVRKTPRLKPRKKVRAKK